MSDLELCKVKIVSNGVISKVEVDGVDMSKASSITYCHVAGNIPTLVIELPVEGMSIDSMIVAKKDDHTVAPEWPSSKITDIAQTAK